MNLSEGPDCVDAQICRGDFYAMLEDAVRECGGIPSNVLDGPDPLINWPLHEVVKLLAQNGIRMVYMPEKHIDRIREVPQ